jgi:hypothetical protein
MVKDGESKSSHAESSAQSALSVEARREPVADAPSDSEVASAFESWREEGNPARAEVAATVEAATAEQEGEAGLYARAPVGGEPESEGEPVVLQSVDADALPAAERVGAEASRRRAGAVVKENIMPRVERMREEALVVLEETPDDAGLRFVIIAVVFFLLFLLLLFLSRVLK